MCFVRFCGIGLQDMVEIIDVWVFGMFIEQLCIGSGLDLQIFGQQLIDIYFIKFGIVFLWFYDYIEVFVIGDIDYQFVQIFNVQVDICLVEIVGYIENVDVCYMFIVLFDFGLDEVCWCVQYYLIVVFWCDIVVFQCYGDCVDCFVFVYGEIIGCFDKDDGCICFVIDGWIQD